MTGTTLKRFAAGAAAGALVFGIVAQVPASAAPSSDVGLFGSADPTYDGVFRQSLAIIGLTSAGVKPSAAAVTWLLDQQCADGAFQSYRADRAVPCGPSDPDAATGPDTNSASAAVSAFAALNRTNAVPAALKARVAAASDKAEGWLAKQQLKDGGWPYFPGSTSDANSTGLALAALMTQAPNFKVPSYVAGSRYLSALVVPCGSADGGALTYQKGAKADGSASSQGLLGLTAGVLVSGPRRLSAAPTCGGTVAQKVSSYLSKQLVAKGAIDSSFGTGPDFTATAVSVLGLVAGRDGKAAVAKAISTLATNVASYTRKDGAAVPSALGLLLMVAEATGKNPTSFGGVNLVTALQGSQR